MNPHFIFNALNSIQEYIMSNEKDMVTYLCKIFTINTIVFKSKSKSRSTFKR